MPEDFMATYHRLSGDYERLRREVEYSLTAAFGEAGINTHAIPSRVKTAESLAEKALDKGWFFDEPFKQASDIVGARVVVHFGSDIEPAREVIRRLFNVVKEEDVGTDEPARFGYSGIHFDAFFKDSDTGPHYQGLHNYKFEIQLRTIVEDAWAAVSHVLGYKGTASIPEDLQRDFYALSGLFYVADQHFEMFYDRAERASETAQEEVARQQDNSVSLPEIPLNADTLAAALNLLFPEREPASRADASELMPDLEAHALTTVGLVVALLDEMKDVFAAYEETNPPGPLGTGRYAAIGVARVSLALASADFRRMRRTDEERAAGHVDDMDGLAQDIINADY